VTAVHHLLTDSAGQPTAGHVTAKLIGAGLRPGTQSQVVRPSQTHVGQDGIWSEDLVPTGLGEFYRVTLQPDSGAPVTLDVQVPASTAHLWLGDLLLTVPVPHGSQLAGLLRGESAYEIAVRLGYVGTEAQWLQSLGGGGGSAVIGDKSITAAKLAFDVATQAELDSLSDTTASSLRTKVNSSTFTAGIADAKNRANHTGTQLADTISDLQTAVEEIIRAYLAANGGGGTTTPPSDIVGSLLTEDGDALTTEAGDVLAYT
jgi:hypothetical protein